MNGDFGESVHDQISHLIVFLFSKLFVYLEILKLSDIEGVEFTLRSTGQVEFVTPKFTRLPVASTITVLRS